MEVIVICFRFFQNVVSKKLGLPEVYVGPERFKKFREACRNNFHLISCNMDSVVTSYDQKSKKLTSIKLTSIHFWVNKSSKTLWKPYKNLITTL